MQRLQMKTASARNASCALLGCHNLKTTPGSSAAVWASSAGCQLCIHLAAHSHGCLLRLQWAEGAWLRQTQGCLESLGFCGGPFGGLPFLPPRCWEPFSQGCLLPALRGLAA